MKKLLDSNKIVPLLLMIISALLAFLGFIGQRQVDSIDNIGEQFSKFQIETIKNNSTLDKTIELFKQSENNRYKLEIHPTTMRSKKNEKDIIKVKSDVSNLKSLIK